MSINSWNDVARGHEWEKCNVKLEWLRLHLGLNKGYWFVADDEQVELS
jgi:hypothetical protein